MRPSRSDGDTQQALTLRWVLVALGIGVVAGTGAIIFDLTIRFVSVIALHDIAATRPPIPSGEGETEVESIVSTIGHPLLLPFVVAAGGFLSALLVQKLAHETAGGGNDAVVAAYHYEGGEIRGRVPFVKLLASAITIGTGGSAGREGRRRRSRPASVV